MRESACFIFIKAGISKKEKGKEEGKMSK